MKKLQKIKKLLSSMVSADIELVIQEAVYWLKFNSYKEAEHVIKMSLDPEIINIIQKEVGRIGWTEKDEKNLYHNSLTKTKQK